MLGLVVVCMDYMTNKSWFELLNCEYRGLNACICIPNSPIDVVACPYGEQTTLPSDPNWSAVTGSDRPGGVLGLKCIDATNFESTMHEQEHAEKFRCLGRRRCRNSITILSSYDGTDFSCAVRTRLETSAN